MVASGGATLRKSKVSELKAALDSVLSGGLTSGSGLPVGIVGAGRAGGCLKAAGGRVWVPRPVGGSAVHPVLTAQLQLVAAESGFLESNPGGYFIVWLRDWRTRES